MLSEALIAIQMLHPKLPEATVKQYADSIDEQAVVAGVDPLSLVSIIERESKFISNIISEDHQDFGLFQVRAQYHKGSKWWLLNPTYNIKVGVGVVKVNVDMCAKHLGRMPKLGEYYACFNGSCGTRERFCRPTSNSSKVERFHDCIVDAVYSDKDIKACQSIYN